MKKLWIPRSLAILLTVAMLFIGCGGPRAAAMYLQKASGNIGVS